MKSKMGSFGITFFPLRAIINSRTEWEGEAPAEPRPVKVALGGTDIQIGLVMKAAR
jgi:hypothetical protein